MDGYSMVVDGTTCSGELGVYSGMCWCLAMIVLIA